MSFGLLQRSQESSCKWHVCLVRLPAPRGEGRPGRARLCTRPSRSSLLHAAPALPALAPHLTRAPKCLSHGTEVLAITPLLDEVHEQGRAGRAQDQAQAHVEGHHHPRGLGQLAGHDLRPVHESQGAEVAVAESQQGGEEHRVEVRPEEHRVQADAGLIVAEHEEGEETGPEEHEPREHLAPGPWHLYPGCDLPATQVGKVKQEEGGEGDEELGGPRRARALVEGLDVGGDGREDEAGDEEEVDDTEAQTSCPLQDGAEGWYGGVMGPRGCQRGAGGVLGCLIFPRKHVGWPSRPQVEPAGGEGSWSEGPGKQAHLGFPGTRQGTYRPGA